MLKTHFVFSKIESYESRTMFPKSKKNTKANARIFGIFFRQMQSTVREHRDGGHAGGIFNRYNILKVIS